MTENVVIAGAGPNGLMLACELALAGVASVVLDELPGPSDEPKANGLVGQVIRQLDMRGLYRRFSGDPNPPRPAHGWGFAGLPLSFVELENNPMYAMLIPQPRLVRLLDARARELGVDVRWGHALTAMSPSPVGVAIEVAGPHGDYSLDARWLVGADGGRSTVRKSLGVGFHGSTAPVVGRLAHVRLPDELLVPGRGYDIPGHGLIPFGSTRFDGGSVVLFPLEADRPMLGTIEYGWTPGSADGPMTLDELKDSVRRLTGADVPAEVPKKVGAHALRRLDGLNSRQAEAYRVGRVLLVGDAAHVHSPMGGPGLNLGMQDAVNLGWKLAAVATGRADEALLDTYESERYPVGERVLLHSRAQLALAAPGPEVDALRTLFGELTQGSEVVTHLAGLLAGSDVRYDVGDEHPLSGLMVPDLAFADGRRLADLMHAARPLLLDPTGRVAISHPGIDVIRAPLAGHPTAALLIRPDGYVAWAADEIGPDDVARCRDALSRWCGTGFALSSP